MKQTDQLPSWNPNFLSLDGTLAKGERFKAYVLRSSGQTHILRGQITRLEAKKNITWQSLGWFALWSKHEHQIKLLAHPEGYTEMIQLSRFKGLILRYLKPEPLRKLKARCKLPSMAY